jgi:hypothetical protein
MATTLFPRSQHPVEIDSDTEVLYNSPSAIGLALSFCLIFLAVFGVIWPNFFSLNLSFMHSLVLGGSGLLSVYAIITRDKAKTYLIYMGLGIFFALNAILGWLLGDPGNPRFGFYSKEQLDTIAPGFMELATVDHIVHAIISVLFFVEAFTWKEYLSGKTHEVGKRSIVRVMKIATIPLIILTIFFFTNLILKGQP